MSDIIPPIVTEMRSEIKELFAALHVAYEAGDSARAQRLTDQIAFFSAEIRSVLLREKESGNQLLILYR